MMNCLLAASFLAISAVRAAPTSFIKERQLGLPPVQQLAASNAEGYVSLIENSGICETTPGVTQYSGYVNQANDTQHFWFWFFAARHNPETAPFTVWFNGGPGCSSMIGLFQEHGPCFVSNDGNSTYLNEYSWNNYSNMIYVDQPIGTGFSFGDDTVNSTVTAAPPVWGLMQTLFENGHFENYTSRKMALWTESYGGHYGPEFVTYFEDQNKLIDNGTITGEKLEMSVLGINNGWYDPLIQNGQYAEYAKYNPYGSIVNNTVYGQAKDDFSMPGGCYDQQIQCYATGNDTVCSDADNFCFTTQFANVIGDLSSYDIKDPENTPFPSEAYLIYLNNTEVLAKIGAKSMYSECADAPYAGFAATGDDDRTTLPELQRILNEGKVRTLIWNGMLDFNCNYFGNEKCLEDPGWLGATVFANQSYREVKYDSNGTAFGEAKTVGNMTWLKVYEAGHEVPAYRPAAAYEVFVKTMKGETL